MCSSVAVDDLANSLQCASRSSTRPVLKHGPRSLVYARVNGRYETLRRNESKGELRLTYMRSQDFGQGRIMDLC